MGDKDKKSLKVKTDKVPSGVLSLAKKGAVKSVKIKVKMK